MSYSLPSYIQGIRESQGMSMPDLAHKCDYRNVNKFCRRIQAFTESGIIHHDLLEKLITALKLDRDTVTELTEADDLKRKQEFEAWVSVPIEPHLVVRLIPGVHLKKSIPQEYHKDESALLDYAAGVARENQWKVCLVLSRRLSYWINADGVVTAKTDAVPDKPNAPYMRKRGKALPFIFLAEG